MRNLNKLLVIIIVCLLTISLVPWTGAENAAPVNSDPIDNHGQKWRIGFAESEPYIDYASFLYYLICGLDELGWVSGTEGIPYVAGQDNTQVMWKWLAARNFKYVEFVPDAYYSLKSMQDDPNLKKEDKIINRLNQRNDIDLMLVMGTKAGLAVANEKHNVPVLVFSASDPVGAGIVKSENDSGIANVWAHIDKNQYRRQIQVFHDIFGFKKMGLVYENTEIARNYNAIGDVEAVAKEKGFELVAQYVYEPLSDQDMERYCNEVLEANRKLAKEVDAMLIVQSIIPSARIPALIEPFHEKKIPTFSQLGTEEVKVGALMSITSNDYPNLKMFGAETIVKVLKGVPLRQLPQVCESTPRIILNFDTAKRIGYRPPFDILLVADEIFRNSKKQ